MRLRARIARRRAPRRAARPPAPRAARSRSGWRVRAGRLAECADASGPHGDARRRPAAPGHRSSLPGDPPVEPVLPADGAVLPIDRRRHRGALRLPRAVPHRRPERPSRCSATARTTASTSPPARSSAATGGCCSPTSWRSRPRPGPGQRHPRRPVPRLHGRPRQPRRSRRPGTYYWQAWRTCLDCPGGYETTPVRSFRLTTAGSSAELTVKPPARAYRGFPFVVSVSTDGIDRGAAVALQVERGAGWMHGRPPHRDGRGDRRRRAAPAPLRPGRKRLRVTAQVGDETLTSPARALRLRKAKGWTTSGRQDGRWTGDGERPRRSSSASRATAARCATAGSSSRCCAPRRAWPTRSPRRSPTRRSRARRSRRTARSCSPAVVRGHASFIHGRIRGEQGDRDRPPLARPLHRQRRLHGEAPRARPRGRTGPAARAARSRTTPASRSGRQRTNCGGWRKRAPSMWS